MDIEDLVFGRALTPLAAMPIAKKDIFPDIPEALLWPLLILSTLYLRVLDLLNVELCHLDSGATDWQDRVNQPDRFQMTINRVLHSRGQPAIRLFSIKKSTGPIARFSAPPCTAKLTACGEQFGKIGSWLHFCLEQNGLFGGSRNPDMFPPRIDANRDLLLVATTAVEQLQGKGNHLHHFGFSRFQQHPGLAWLTGH